MSEPLSARVFTDVGGNTYQGSVVHMTEDQVTLMVPAKGKVYKIALSQLSPGDRVYIQSLRDKQNRTTRSGVKTPSLKLGKKGAGEEVKRKAAGNTRGQPTSKLKAQYRLVDNYLTHWPKRVSIAKTVHVRSVSQDKVNKRYIYHSPSYEFICDVPLSKRIIAEFGLMFEATREYCRLLPISSMKAHVPKHEKRNRILLFEDQDEYVRNGGHARAAGVYIPGKNIILIPLASLGVKKVGGRYNYDYTGSSRVLVHEIVHQLTDPEYFSVGARGWFSEGLAEYCALTKYGSGNFAVRNLQREIKDYVVGGEGSIGIGKKTNAPDLRDFMLQPYSSFTSNGPYNYRLGVILTYYFFHMERDRKNINGFLQALKRGEAGEASLKHLLNGRNFDELERDIRNAWIPAGIEINFQ